MIGKVLGGRYKVTSILATGGMSQTYLARDTQRPGQPTCVVKRLQPPSVEPEQLQLARRLFNTEAEVLHQLGTHEQIPQLLAYFEEAGEFYLVQEFIEGILLFDQLRTGTLWSEAKVTQFLKDVLQLLCFVHDRGAIHRDIKPGNLIQRPDGTWVLLDFGAVKQVHLTQRHNMGQDMSITVAIGTPGYLAPESICGKPRFSSDIFSLGIIAICALTGLSPDAVQDAGSLQLGNWQTQVSISDRLQTILEQMTQLNYALRYTTAKQVLAELTPNDSVLHDSATGEVSVSNNPTRAIPATVLPTLVLPATVYLARTVKRLSPLVQAIPDLRVRTTRQLVGVGLCVGLSIGGLHQLARASQTRARSLLDSLAIAERTADYAACIETAETISSFSPVHRDAQAIVGNCQLAQARQQAQAGFMRDAIATAHLVPRSVPAYKAAQADIPAWSERILELATAQYHQGELDTAIAMADAIPNYSPTRPQARQTIRTWRREWQRDEHRFQQAQQAFDRGEWSTAIADTEDITSPYWQTQAASLVQQANARLQAIPQAPPIQAPVAVSAPPAPQPAAVTAPAPAERRQVERNQQDWVQIQRNIEQAQRRQQVRVLQERVWVERDDDDDDDDDDDNRQRVRARSNRQNRNRNSRNRDVTIEDRVINELENQIIRGVEGLLN